MTRVTLIQWTPGGEAKAELLRQAGLEVEVRRPRGGTTLAELWARPPDAYVIDLDRRPSDGWNLGILLRQRKASRRVPLVFAGGAADKRRRARRVLPDAAYCDWRDVVRAVRRAASSPPVRPVVPGTMDGYSGTPLPRKLGVKAGFRVALLGAPDDFESTLGELPGAVSLKRRAVGEAELVLLFCRARRDLERRFAAAAKTVAEGGGLWLAWPKKASGLQTDLAEGDVRAWGLERGWVDYKIAAIDATWSGLKFARRK